MRVTFSFIITLVLLLSGSLSHAQLLLHPWELTMNTVNGSSDITFAIVATSSQVWEPHGINEHSTHLTNDPNYVDPDDITVPGNYNQGNRGWNSDKNPYNQPPFLGRGYYLISVEGKSATLVVDCYGTDFQGDICVLYDYFLDVFKVDGKEVTEINLYDDPTGLQPTPPRNFHCTNPTAYGHHPHFSWSAPEEPDGVTFYYNIYRDLGAGYRKITANPLTATEYIDTGIEIIKFGSNTAHYYVTAKGSESPESEASDIVDIKTNTAEKILPQQEMPDSTAANYIEPSQIRLLGNYPNPFNSTTMIQYSLPQASHVTLKIFNLQGEVVKMLVAGNQTANHYQVLWHGENEIGEKVAAGIYLYHLATDNYSQIKRMIFIK